MTGADTVEVRLEGVPVALWAASQEHFQDLLREFSLIAAGAGSNTHPIPARLVELVERLTTEYAGVGDEQEAALAAAAREGAQEIDLVFQVPPGTEDAAVALGRVLDEADDYCRAGEHLLTLATPPECVAYRRWYIAQFVDQIAGAAPVPWTAWTR
jgi:hypothetical protein